MSFRILTDVAPISEAEIRAFNDIEVVNCAGAPRSEILLGLDGYDGFVASDELAFDHEFFEAGKSLKVLSRFGIGVNNVDLVAANRHGVAVTNAPGANAVSVAEHTIGLIISATRRIPIYDRELKRGEWPRGSIDLGFELSGKVLGQVGFGRIGSLVAKMCKSAFGMEVLVHDPFVSPEEVSEQLDAQKVDIETIFEKSDVISLNMPETEQTKGLVSKQLIQKMKPLSVLVNTARGGVIVERDLCDALGAGQILGAGLDVTFHEPPRSGDPITALENVVLTGHSASNTVEFFARTTNIVLSDQKRIFEGKPPKHLVLS